MAKKTDQRIKPEYGLAVYSQAKTCYKILKVYAGLIPLMEKYAATTDMKKHYKEGLVLKRKLEEVYNTTRKKVETELSNKMMGKMSKKYKVFGALVTIARDKDTEEMDRYATELENNLDNVSMIFKTKGEFIANLNVSLSKIRILPEDLRKALNVDSVVEELDAMIKDYNDNFLKKVEDAVESSGSCSSALEKLRENYCAILALFDYLYKAHDSSEDALIAAFNKFCVQYSAAIKVGITAKEKADAKAKEKAKAKAADSKK